MKDKRFIIGVLVVTGLILVGGVYGALRFSGSTGAEVEQAVGSRIKMSKELEDFGEVTLNGGDVVKTFEVENVGEKMLSLANFSTSCMCTTVKVKTASEESIDFGMHTKSKWVGYVAPGETAEVIVTYDPAFHGPSGKGAITRIVKFETNDPESPRAEFMLTGKVI